MYLKKVYAQQSKAWRVYSGSICSYGVCHICSMYLDDIKIGFNRIDCNTDREWGDNEPMLSIFKQIVWPIDAKRYEFMDVNELSKAHFYVLNNYKEIEDFIE